MLEDSVALRSTESVERINHLIHPSDEYKMMFVQN